MSERGINDNMLTPDDDWDDIVSFISPRIMKLIADKISEEQDEAEEGIPEVVGVLFEQDEIAVIYALNFPSEVIDRGMRESVLAAFTRIVQSD